MDESTLNTQPPSTDPAVSPADWGAPAGFGPGPAAAPSSEELRTAGAALRTRAFKQFGLAVAFLVVGIALILWASGGSAGVIFYGPFIVGIALLIRAISSYRGSVGAGASSTSKDRGLLVGAGIVVVVLLIAGGFAGTKLVGHEKDTHASTGVGSCWKEQSGANLAAVSCSHAHQYVGTAVVTDDNACGTDTVGTVAADDGGRLCLAKS